MPSKSLKYWVLTLFILNAFYLVMELAFNAHLVDTASNIGLSQDELDSVEHIGRLVSGIGFALLMSGLIPNKLRESIGNAMSVWLCFLICVPTMYFGQRAIIDYIVDSKFSAQERQLAQYSVLLKSGIAKNTIKFKNIDFDPKLSDSPEQKTFLALLGAVVFQSTSIINDVKKQQNSIARRYVHNLVVDKEDEYWDQYHKSHLEFKKQWVSYKKHSKTYVKEHNKVGEKVDNLWEGVEKNLNNNWKRYKNGVSSYRNTSYQKAEDLRHNLNKYFAGKDKCRNKSCRQRYERKYEQQIQNKFGKYIEPEFWLTKKSLSWSERNCKKSSNGTHCKSNILEFINPFSWFGNEDKKVWDSSRQAVGERLVILNKKTFMNNSGGYDYTIKSFPDFKYHKVTVKKLRNKLNKQGIKTNSQWKAKKDADFINAAAIKVRKDIDSQWYKNSKKKFKSKIAPNLKYSSFIRTSLIKNKLKQQLKDNYVKNMRPDYNRDDFFKKVLMPLINRNAKRILTELHAKTKKFEDGGKYEEKGKQYIRSLIVPPISLGLSLFFALIASIKFPLSMIKLRYLFKNKKTNLTSSNKLQASILAGTALFIVFLPFIAVDNKFSSETSGFRILLDDASNNNLLVGQYIEWIIRTQPIVYPIGEQVVDLLEAITYKQ